MPGHLLAIGPGGLGTRLLVSEANSKGLEQKTVLLPFSPVYTSPAAHTTREGAGISVLQCDLVLCMGRGYNSDAAYHICTCLRNFPQGKSNAYKTEAFF